MLWCIGMVYFGITAFSTLIMGIWGIVVQEGIDFIVFCIVMTGICTKLALLCNKRRKMSPEEKMEKRLKKQEIIEQKQKEQEEKEKRQHEHFKMIPGTQERIDYLNAKECIAAKHIDGLPIAESSTCRIYLCENKIIFERNEMTFNLDFERINDIVIKSDVEIQKSYISSAGGAVGGAMLFGALGAMVGGRVKEKTDTKESNYLIFAYTKDEEMKYISFDVTDCKEASHFPLAFNKKVDLTQRKEVNL